MLQDNFIGQRQKILSLNLVSYEKHNAQLFADVIAYISYLNVTK